ncbi:hypothetical protein BDZ89DRAFT_1044874 [Hymenopellis radicata]|nr:hypothetical protein BDZ89DRAFT_1044874 [Hymenopellis radicata]
MSEAEPILFEPRNGEYYQRGDYEHVCSQQPLPMDELPEYLCALPGWTPPKLWLAWPRDLGILLKTVEKVYPSLIIRTHRREGEPLRTSVCALPRAIRRDFVPDPDFHECVQLVTVALENGEQVAAIAVGCTRIGMLSAKAIGEIQAKLGFEEPPKWCIDPHFWKWRQQTLLSGRIMDVCHSKAPSTKTGVDTTNCENNFRTTFWEHYVSLFLEMIDFTDSVVWLSSLPSMRS